MTSELLSNSKLQGTSDTARLRGVNDLENFSEIWDTVMPNAVKRPDFIYLDIHMLQLLVLHRSLHFAHERLIDF